MNKAKLYTTIVSIVCAAALSGCIINTEQPKDVSPIIESTIKLTDAITVEIAKEPPKEGYELYYTPFDDIDFYPGFTNGIALHTPELQLIEHDEEAVAPETEPELRTSVWGAVTPASYGTSYGTISCSKIGLYSSLIWGDDQGLLDSRKGVCQYTGSYQVGYGGCHLLCAHNNGAFSLLQYVSIGDKFVVDTNYGQFVYQVDSARAGTVTSDGGTVVADDGTVLVNLADGMDRLYMYTCYPFGYYQSTPQRYVVMATLVS